MKQKTSLYYIAYFDILGYKAIFEDEDTDILSFLKNIVKLADDVLHSVSPQGYLSEKFHVKTFSDNFIILLDASNDDEYQSIKSMGYLLAVLQLRFLKKYSILIRGGITDSGIEWIGEIPKHWEVSKLSKFFTERKCKNKKNKETNVLSLSYGNIKRRNVETNMGLLPESFETYNIIEPGNIVLRLTDLQNDHRSLRCGYVKEKGIITSAYVTLENKDENSNINGEYFYLLLHTFDIKKGFYGMGDGVRQNLKFNGELNKIMIIFPTIEEQNKIVSFLNNKAETIENTINQTDNMIKKLEQYKKSLIYECVTGKREVK